LWWLFILNEHKEKNVYGNERNINSLLRN